MTAGTSLTQQQVAAILTRLRKGVESHNQIAADQGLSRHTVHRIARVHGIPNQTARAALPPRGREWTDDSWKDAAKCRGLLDFTEGDEAIQQQVCEPEKFGMPGPDCPVKDNCLESALEDGPPFGGVFGGKSPDELRRIWRARRREARAGVAS